MVLKQMKSSFLVSLIILMLVCSCKQKNLHVVKFEIEVSNLPENKSVYITGNHEKLGSWNPKAVKLDQSGQDRFEKEFVFEKGDELEFKFTLGTWSEEALDDQAKPRENQLLNVQKDTSIQISILQWKSDTIQYTEGQVTGKVVYHKQLEWKGLASRDIVVWLPPNYEKEKNRKYSVLYMQDGQNCFDPKTSSFGVDWQIDESCTDLIGRNTIEPLIVVGIYNTPNRSKEYVPGLDGDRYMELLTKKIKPFIDSNYRTYGDREHTAVGGSSAGGTISFMLLWEYPEIFSKAICMSPAFKIEDIDYVKVVRGDEDCKRDIRIYIDNGGIGLEKRLQTGIDEMLVELQKKGYVLDRDLFWQLDTTAQHNEKAWAKRMPQALKILFAAP
ncbi:alpha/beta hydrolase-fold protein [Marinifilum caeruleilacunae]|uniref:Histidine kinase n=1 Tax=Marinifilum caeruleilacunae TaxID=2499076 RepID=A0ABX1WWU5_9BACT|nr:alpha/beta hydrolase-fold protein [Marinifilum caeruleilacunae]NOU60456.1 histidine kinase [Marinifilum caeruleilacunae]